MCNPIIARLSSLTSPAPPNGAKTPRSEEPREEEEKTSAEKKPKLAIPAPSTPAREVTGSDFLAVLDSIGKKEAKEEVVKEEEVVEANDMFVIDKTGEEEAKEEAVVTPVKQLKRRNASMYSQED